MKFGKRQAKKDRCENENIPSLDHRFLPKQPYHHNSPIHPKELGRKSYQKIMKRIPGFRAQC